ncbi:unnamed protein product [Spirodela intermedia]|uniref:Uncharacterized protein n=1 Tax=Spirodela intermedia TaxID=51605 RepID=A0A7I8KH98_SPIIN|nr:unnamed protein product [Spirodela intermedia]
MAEPLPEVQGEARLTDAEMARTIIEVHSKAALLFSALINDEVQENIFWPELSYLTDEHGDIYFEMKDDEDILQTLNADDKLVQVIVGLDNIERLSEMDLLGPSNVDFGIEDITNEDPDITDDYEQVVSSIHLDWMEQPPASLVIQGLLRPTIVEDSFVSRKPNQSEKAGREESLQSGTSFYKLEIINIYLSLVKIEDFRKAQPDILAHSAAKIISRLKSCGDKIIQALKSLCLRSKGLHVEEVFLSGLDSLGFDLRVCSGTQIQTLRFSFRLQATSEYSAERQIHEILFPRIQHNPLNQQVDKHGPVHGTLVTGNPQGEQDPMATPLNQNNVCTNLMRKNS